MGGSGIRCSHTDHVLCKRNLLSIPREVVACHILFFLVLAHWLLLFLDPHFYEDLLAASLCFVCFVSAVLFAFAADALAHYPKTAHAVALAAIAALPWIYTSVLRGNIYWNEWIVFNVPDREGRTATFAITSELPSVGGTVEVVSCYGDLSPTSGLKRVGGCEREGSLPPLSGI